MKISIDDDLCQGHGRCWDVAPELVGDDDMGRGVITAPGVDVDPDLEAKAQAAANACPERAITLSG